MSDKIILDPEELQELVNRCRTMELMMDIAKNITSLSLEKWRTYIHKCEELRTYVYKLGEKYGFKPEMRKKRFWERLNEAVRCK